MSNDQQTGASPVTRVEFELDGGPYPFVAASDTLGCEFELAEMVPRGDGEYAEFFDVHGADPERVLDGSKSNSAVDATLIRESEDGGLFEFVVSEHCPAVSLAEQGALPRTVHGSEGRGRVVAEIPPQYDPASVIAAFLEENPESELVCKQK